LWSVVVAAPLQAQAAPASGRLLGVEIFPAEVKPARPDSAVSDEAEGAAPDSSPRFAWFCFGPTFGNAAREIDPNYMPPPAATNGSSETAQAEPVAPVRYTRIVAKLPDRATWVGWDGSEISYRVPPGSGPKSGFASRPGFNARDRAEPATSAEPANPGPRAEAGPRPSVAELIAENRREMTRISWERAYRRFPQLEREDGPEREAFDAYLLKRYADPREAAAFDNPMWPEAAAAAFVAERDWTRAEAESWDRVRARVRIFNDPESAYTRRFMEFATGLRADPEGSELFARPDWPERALELHNERFGAVPEQFR
jgi:hypothetical protein